MELDSATYFKQREEELLRLNEKLNIQKAAVLQSADEAVKAAQESLKRTPFTPLSVSPPQVPPPKEATITGVTVGASLTHLESLQATVRYQKARVQALQEELEKVSKVTRDRETELAALKQEFKILQEDNKKWMKKANSVDTDIDKIAKKATNSELAVKEAEEELIDLRRQRDVDQGALKKADADAKAKEVKMNRLLEENDRLKSTVKEAKSSERDKLTGEKDAADKLAADVKRLTKQRTELINAFKKQSKLIDILRRQKTHLEAARILNFTEEEFITALKLEEVSN